MRCCGRNPRSIPDSVRMTDVALAASPLATPFTVWLASVQPQLEKAVYHAVLTLQELDARAREIEALTTQAAVHDLGWLRRVQVRGEDRVRWLSGMVTNMVKDLPRHSGAWNLVLNAQGRIQGELTVWHDDGGLEIETTADQLDRLLSHLNHFIIMDDVELLSVDGDTALGLTGPEAGDVLGRLGLPTLTEPMTQTAVEWNGFNLTIRRGFGVFADHYELWAPPAALSKLWSCIKTGGASPVGAAAFEAFRVAEGMPVYGTDILEKDLPQEISQTRGLSFNKGCYLGQEIVERIRSRGSVHRHLRQVELDGPLAEPGTELKLDDVRVGHITSAAELPPSGGPRRFALAMIRAEAEVRNEPFSYASSGMESKARLLNGAPNFRSGLDKA